VHAYYYIVKNPVDRIQSPDCLDPAGSGFCRILICLIVCIQPDPKKTPDIRPDPDPDPVHL